MPNLELLLDNVAQEVKIPKTGEIFFSAIDLRYTSAQKPLKQKTKEQGNFSQQSSKSS